MNREPEEHTEKPPPSSESSMAIKAIVNTGLQEATEDWGDRDGRLKDAVALSKLVFDEGTVSAAHASIGRHQ